MERNLYQKEIFMCVCVPEEDYISTLGKESSNTDKRIVYVDWPQSQAAHRICMKITYWHGMYPEAPLL